MNQQCNFNGNFEELLPSLAHDIPMLTISTENAATLFNSFITQNDEKGIDGKCDFNMTEYNDWGVNVANIDRLCIGGNLEVNLITNNDLSWNGTISNLFAYKRGEIYPNEIVMIGAHRDVKYKNNAIAYLSHLDKKNMI